MTKRSDVRTLQGVKITNAFYDKHHGTVVFTDPQLRPLFSVATAGLFDKNGMFFAPESFHDLIEWKQR